MSEEVLGFKKKKMTCHYCGKLGEPKMLTFLCKECADIPILKKQNEIKLVPVVELAWLKKYCRRANKTNRKNWLRTENQCYYEKILARKNLLSAVRVQAGEKK